MTFAQAYGNGGLRWTCLTSSLRSSG
jgi:hypothetical protein